MNTTLNDLKSEDDGSDPPWNLIAAQYVLGTLSASARLRFQSRLQEDAELRALTHAWERRLNPLTHLLNPQPVPVEIWQNIEARLDGLSKANAKTTIPQVSSIELQPTAQTHAANDHYWKPFAWISTAIAASLALFIVVKPAIETLNQPVATQQLQTIKDVAVLSTDTNHPAWIVRLQGQSLILSALNTPSIPSNHSLELWSIHDQAKPRSLGVIHLKDGQAEVNLVTHDLISQYVTLAISLEPQNGSPTGQPTGAVLYTGRIIRT